MSSRARTCPRRRERGASQSLQWALLAPVVMLAIMGLVQAAIIFQGQQAARQAAMAGAEAESWLGAPPGSGAGVAERVAISSGLNDIEVSVVREQGMAVVTVTGTADVFLQVGQGRVIRTASVPLEQP